MIPSHTPVLVADVRLTFEEAQHVYLLDGKPIPGVTTILKMFPKPWLGPWMRKAALEIVRAEWEAGKSYTDAEIEAALKSAKGEADRKSKVGRDTGTEVHEWIEDYIKHRIAGGPFLCPMDHLTVSARTCAESFRQWERKTNPTWHHSERQVYHEGEWYAGTYDNACTINGMGWLGDVKTSNTFSDDWGPQTEAYVRAEGSMLGYPPEQRLEIERFVLWLAKDNPKQPFQFCPIKTDPEKDWAVFKACHLQHRYQNYLREGKGEWG